MKIHKPCIFYLLGVVCGILAVKCGSPGALVVVAGFALGIWLDGNTEQIERKR